MFRNGQIYCIAKKLNSFSKVILLFSVCLLSMLMQIDFTILPDYDLPAVAYLITYSKFKIVTHNALIFSLFIGELILLLTLPYYLLNIIYFIKNDKNNLNIDEVYGILQRKHFIFKLFNLVGVIFALLYFLNYINIIQVNIPFASMSVIIGISKSKVWLFLFSILFSMIGVGYCVNILFFYVFLIFRSLKG